MSVAVYGLEPLEGETAFAFVVIRLRTAVDRGGLLEVLRYIAPLIPDADAFIDEFPDELDGALRIIGIPWGPAESGLAVEVQRRLIEGAGVVGIDAAWFFQTGTSLPLRDDEDDDDPDDDDDLEDDEGTRVVVRRAPTSTGESRRASTSTGEQVLAAVSGEIWSGEVTDTQVSLALDNEPEPDDDEDAELDAVLATAPPRDPADLAHDDDETWSHGPPAQAREVRFPVDGYPAIIEELDREDFGIAFKLAGPQLPGESTVLLGFHTLWLAPYGDRYRNTAVTIDPAHHSAHLWVDRFAVPCRAEELVHHLLWIVAKLDEVVPVLHARFGPASMAQKYGGSTEDSSEPFVLGGNPLLPLYQLGGETAVDAWIADQHDWSPEELAVMLRELAVEIVSVTSDDDEPQGVPTRTDEPDDDAAGGDDDDDGDDGDDDDDDDDDDADGDDDDDESEGADDEDRGRHIARQAAELLRARAYAGKLDARAGEALITRARAPNPPRALVEVLGVLGPSGAVQALLDILEHSIDDELVATTARALGAIGDPRAVPALCDVAAAAGSFVAKPAAAAALAACLAGGREMRGLDDAELAEVLAAIIDAGDGRLDPITSFACGRIARLLPPHRRAEARRRLAELAPPELDPLAQLARMVALQLASPAVPAPPPPAEARSLLERALTELAGSQAAFPPRWRLALEIAATVPELAEATALLPLTRVLDPETRRLAHAVLARLGRPEPVAPIFDAAAAHRLDDAELVRRLDTVHVVGRDALVAEIGRRKLPAARPTLLGACHTAIATARGGDRLFEHDRRLLAAALPILARTPDAEVGAVVDRMAQHPNAALQRLAKKWHHLRHDDEGIN